MVEVPPGPFLMGTDDAHAIPADGEGPVREVTVAGFRIDAHGVTNEQFAAFVDDTGHVTDAERIGWSFVFAGMLLPRARRHVLPATLPEAPWWLAVANATWRSPEGPGSTVADRGDHPVVHVSWRDADAYATWSGTRLPSEAEWEKAARGGLVGARYPWGDELVPDGVHQANLWQGTFPTHNSAEDGHLGTAPVRSFAANGYGLHEVAGNVWEWCADWWSTEWHAEPSCANRIDPTGPPSGRTKVLRGGSFLCHDAYCDRYRVAARTHNAPDATTSHTGFRCASARSRHG